MKHNVLSSSSELLLSEMIRLTVFFGVSELLLEYVLTSILGIEMKLLVLVTDSFLKSFFKMCLSSSGGTRSSSSSSSNSYSSLTGVTADLGASAVFPFNFRPFSNSESVLLPSTELEGANEGASSSSEDSIKQKYKQNYSTVLQPYK